MRLAVFENIILSNLEPVTAVYSVTLAENQVYRLPRMFPTIRVVAGSAWITFRGEDIILNKGEKFCFDLSGEIPVITALGKIPLMLEFPQAK